MSDDHWPVNRDSSVPALSRDAVCKDSNQGCPSYHPPGAVASRIARSRARERRRDTPLIRKRLFTCGTQLSPFAAIVLWKLSEEARSEHARTSVESQKPHLFRGLRFLLHSYLACSWLWSQGNMFKSTSVLSQMLGRGRNLFESYSIKTQTCHLV